MILGREDWCKTWVCFQLRLEKYSIFHRDVFFVFQVYIVSICFNWLLLLVKCEFERIDLKTCVVSIPFVSLKSWPNCFDKRHWKSQAVRKVFPKWPWPRHPNNQIPPKKIFGPKNHTQNTFSGGILCDPTWFLNCSVTLMLLKRSPQKVPQKGYFTCFNWNIYSNN